MVRTRAGAARWLRRQRTIWEIADRPRMDPATCDHVDPLDRELDDAAEAPVPG